jgi:hypothetical protein
VAQIFLACLIPAASSEKKMSGSWASLQLPESMNIALPGVKSSSLRSPFVAKVITSGLLVTS